MNPIYLDHNATTPLHPSVLDAMIQCYQQGYANPASQHQMGQLARRALEQARSRIAQSLGARTTGMPTDRLIFTSGGTESNNLAIIGLATAALEQRRTQNHDHSLTGRVLISAIEHPSVVGAAHHLAQLGFEVQTIGVNQDGVCQLELLESLLQQPTDLVSLMLANHETGSIQPVAEAATICHRHQTLIHTDAVQAVGKIRVDFQKLNVDALSLTAHKMGGPRGIGGLLIRPGIPIYPLLFGGFQQSGFRPGTEDVALAVGFQKAIEFFEKNPDKMKRVAQLRDQLQAILVRDLDNVAIASEKIDRVPQTLNVSFLGIDRQSFFMAADMAQLAISTGSACASGSSEISPVLAAMGLPQAVLEGSIRISLGISTTPEEIVESGRRILKIVNQLRPRK